MSKKTFRKGVALATGLSFGLVGIAGTPAFADKTGRVTLTPEYGESFNSLITDGIRLVSDIDGDLDVNDQYLTYKIENPNKERLSFDTWTYDGDANYNVKVLKNGELQNASADGNGYYDDAVIFVQSYDGYANLGGYWSEDPNELDIFTGEDDHDVTIKVTAWLDRSEDGVLDADESQFATDTETVNLYDPAGITGKVVFDDEDLYAGSRSVDFTVKLNKDVNITQINTTRFAAAFYENGSAKQLIDSDIQSDLTDSALKVDLLRLSVNNDDELSGRFYPADSGFDLNDDGDTLDTIDTFDETIIGWELDNDDNQTDTDLGALYEGDIDSAYDEMFDYNDDGDQSDTLSEIVESDVRTWTSLIQANYSARLAWVDESDPADYSWAGTRSTSFSVAEGTNSDVEALSITTSDSKNSVSVDANSGFSEEDFDVRPGTKSVTLTAQAIETDADGKLVALEASNVRVRATVYIDNYVDGTKVTVSGSSESLTSDSGDITVYGRTDADGKFSITVTSTTAADGEGYDVDFEYLDIDGVWYNEIVGAGDLGETSASIQANEDIDVDYVDAYVDTFEFASDILAGSSVKATVSVEDQYGQAISTLDGDALKVFLTDSEDFEKSANVSSGKAEFSFTNWLEKGDIATLEASLYTGSDETDLVDVSTSDNPIEATLYNPEATGAVIVDAEADINITQEAFIVGEEDADADIVAPSENELVYEGIVEDANGAGLPAAVVTIKGAGLQFEEITDISATPDETAGEWFKDSITVVADETGYFAVNVWAHKVGETVITVTSGGKSDTTTLTAAFGALTEDDVKISWNAPKHPAINGLYAVTIKVTDLWGNAIEGADLEINTDGALQVNGDDFKEKTTNAAGKATVYVGGVKDMKGFGGITADVTRVYIDVAGNDVDDDADGEIEANEIDLVDTLLSSGDLADGDFTSVTQEVLVGVSASAAAGKNAGVVVAKAWNTKGKTLQVYVGGKLKATRTTVSGVDTVKLTGIKTGSKLVTIKVGGSTYFSGYVTVK